MIYPNYLPSNIVFRYSGTWAQGLSSGVGVLKTARGNCMDIKWGEHQEPLVYSGDKCGHLGRQ